MTSPAPAEPIKLHVPADLVAMAANIRAKANTEESLRPDLQRVLLAALRAGLTGRALSVKR